MIENALGMPAHGPTENVSVPDAENLLQESTDVTGDERFVPELGPSLYNKSHVAVRNCADNVPPPKSPKPQDVSNVEFQFAAQLWASMVKMLDEGIEVEPITKYKMAGSE